MEHSWTHAGKARVVNVHFMEKAREELLAFMNSFPEKFSTRGDPDLRAIPNHSLDISAAIVDGYSKAMGGDMLGEPNPPISIASFRKRAKDSVEEVRTNLKTVDGLKPHAQAEIVALYDSRIKELCGKANSFVNEYRFNR